jgi:alpha-tubulin suppressor-like RCC1 family protein
MRNSLLKKGLTPLALLGKEIINLLSKRDFIVITFFTILGMGGVFAAGLVTLTPSESQGAGYLRATACDENVTIKALTAPDAATGQLYVATIALSDISQNTTTGCGRKIMQIALKINGQISYASLSIVPSSTDSTFYLTGATSSVSEYYADTILSPFQADGLTNVAISQIGVMLWTESISTGGNHTCAILSGAVKCWGHNDQGQVGDATSGTNRTSPVAVSGLSSGVTKISAGYNHTCALLSTGAVKCWGYNEQGQIGDATSGTNRTSPVAVSGLSSGVTAISTTGQHTCALLSTGAVKCWGHNNLGQIGDTTSGTNRTSPVAVSGLSSGVTAISAGDLHTCALLSSGAVKCWGHNNLGQIGDTTSGTNRTSPVDVSGLSSGVTAISAGGYHTCALLSSGAVKCWGWNGFGQIGDATSGTNRTSPVAVSGLSSGVTAISAGNYHTCALLSSGAVKCWGHNTQYGQIGDGTLGTNRTSPVAVSGLSSGVTAISNGDFHTCAILSSGAVKCWGLNGQGQIGDGTSGTNRTSPVSVLGIP